jgi:hypothetical protein
MTLLLVEFFKDEGISMTEITLEIKESLMDDNVITRDRVS